MNVKKVPAVSMVILLAGLWFAAFGGVSEGAEPVKITDGTGRVFEYTQPTERIVTMGYASTLTVAMLGEIDKIIAVDTYSTYDYTHDERLKDLDAANMGSIYTASNNDKIMTQFLQWVEGGKMSLDDTIVLTTYSNANLLRDQLNDAGFNYVLVYLSVTSYGGVVDFVRSMSIIVTGEVSSIVDDMELVKTTIDERLIGVTNKAKGMGVWYSTSLGLQVNNTGSISVSLIDSAGGLNVAYNPSVSAARYGDSSTIIQMVDRNPDVVIFLSDTYTLSHSVSDFRNTLLGGKDVSVVIVDSAWNNYCPDAAEGLWAFACALYPDLFEGPAPRTDESSEPEVLPYAAVGFVAVVFTAGMAYFFLRRP
ncbi:MAG: hypothetical protein LBB30_03230 [Candidatus Methanoplasma sp.]|jgi:ABC-type Fe3+-hydroxamate transport system substrate-binding protein|nr:hypothetical protein [Candidatus Methanoplasma sp.]